MSTYEQEIVKSFEEYRRAVAKHAGKRKIALFSGSLNEKGESWCPDCRVAEPVIESSLEEVKGKLANTVIIYCEVGDRPTWKNPENAYRKDDKLRLKCVPTLIDIESGKRLEEGQCADAELVKMILEDA